MTSYLQEVIELTQPYAVVLPRLMQLLEGVETPQVLDLASGAGGPWPGFAIRLRERIVRLRVQLTDLYPNRAAMERFIQHESIDYSRDPRSALDPNMGKATICTCFTALHHFEPAEVKKILRNAQQSRVAFLGAEATERSWKGVVATLFIPPLVWIVMPRVKPRRFLTLTFTYLLPVLPLLIAWDGLASTLRSYTKKEMEQMIEEISEPWYSWEVIELRIPRAPIPVLCLVGKPVSRE